MPTGRLRSLIQALECELQSPATRRDVRRLDELLHSDFIEIGRSGRRYSKAEVLELLPNDVPTEEIRSSDFELLKLGVDAMLLGYRSVVVDRDGRETRPARRTSVWVHAGNGWQIIFHQATPAE